MGIFLLFLSQKERGQIKRKSASYCMLDENDDMVAHCLLINKDNIPPNKRS